MIVLFLGIFSLCIGLIILFLPLLLTELSRPRDGFLGALLLVLGLILFLDSDRFRGSPTLAILSGTLLVAQIGLEAFQARWEMLSIEEKGRVWTLPRWFQSFKELILVSGELGVAFFGFIKTFTNNQKKNSVNKKWVRPESNKLNESKKDSKSDKKDLLENKKEEP